MELDVALPVNVSGATSAAIALIRVVRPVLVISAPAVKDVEVAVPVTASASAALARIRVVRPVLTSAEQRRRCVIRTHGTTA